MTDNPHNPFVHPSAPTWEIGGETLRDKYAGLAPDNIPSWFEPTGVPDPPSPVILPPVEYFGTEQTDVNSSQVDLCNGYYDFETEAWNDVQYNLDYAPSTIEENYPGFRAQVGEYTIDYKSYSHHYDVWNKHYLKERYFQWRFYYADELLLKREGEPLS
ncbi:MAG TPA: hypothetical protein ACFYEK_01110 [Candidatus Wunengus sp. YC60]|uniref:hypothetical protein n=1 Tax=Candidatus Wunengus sp. YC60 TaxID=3367697 RepID=UPI004026B09C